MIIGSLVMVTSLDIKTSTGIDQNGLNIGLTLREDTLSRDIIAAGNKVSIRGIVRSSTRGADKEISNPSSLYALDKLIKEI